MQFVNIFGEPVKPPSKMEGKRKGYAARPGTGPQGETCRTCKHKVTVGLASKSIVKCGLMRPVWTHGYGTDILASWPACAKWEAKGA